jgi:molecular chaperone DnaJ
VNEAYQVLSDKNKRTEYDRFGATSGSGTQDFGDFSNIHDIFNNLFGMGMKQKREGFSNYDVNTEEGSNTK